MLSEGSKLKIGIIREGKIPPDARVPLSPEQCVEVQARFPVTILVEPSPVRCFSDAEYEAAGIEPSSELSNCDVLIGVKEVPVAQLIPNKTYLFFSHTIKKQPYNRGLLQAILAKNIRMIDYETLTDDKGTRLIAFGYYAGVVGAHNGIWAYGQRTGLFSLPRMFESHDYAEVKAAYAKVNWPPVRVVLTGGGRVATGAIHNLKDMGFEQVSPADFLQKDFQGPVFTQLHAADYVRHHSHPETFDKAHYYRHGEEYVSVFAPYYRRADVFINAIYYDAKAPRFFSVEEMRRPDFRLSVIADLSCDMMPDSSVPATIKPCKIHAPLYGFDPYTETAIAPGSPGCVDMMTIDNLPSELPRDASVFFGKQLISNILPEFFVENSEVLNRAVIAENGKLTPGFAYLEDYVNGME